MIEEEALLSLLAGQIEEARSRAERARGEGKDTTTLDAIVASLRLTYAAQSAGMDPQSQASQPFFIETRGHRDPVVCHAGREVPLSSGYLKHLFSEAGMEPVPGEVILLDAPLVRDLIEEALGRIAYEEAQVERWKAELEAILARRPELRLESVETASREAQSMSVGIRRRKVDLIAAGLSADDLAEKKAAALREGVKEPPAAAA